MNSFKYVFLVALQLICISVIAQSSVVRGPYLNTGTPNSMVVRWRTTGNEVGVVKYGTNMNNLTETVTEAGAGTEHELKITGLSPYTKYYYTIGVSGHDYTANDGSYFFKTSPQSGDVKPYRFWALGDFGNGSQAQKDVKTGFRDNYTDVDTDVWFWLGDNAYGDGTDQQYQEKVFEVYPEVFKNTVVWPSPGNHDYGSVDALSHDGPYYEIFTLPVDGEAGGVASGEEGHYSFDYGNVHFLSLNTEYLLWIISGSTSFTDWLEEDLQNTTADWIIAYWHQPAYSKGTHDSDDNFSRPQMMRQNVLPILEEYGVDLVLAGHSHSYERSYLINGHYGTSSTWDPQTMLVDGSNGRQSEGNEYVKYTNGNKPNYGTVYATVGCGGQKGDGSHDLNHPVMYMSTEDYHGSMVIDVDGMTLTARFIDTTGAVLDDFTIVKQEETGIAEQNYNHNIALRAYPNPFKESFTIEFELEEREKAQIEIRDIEGAIVESFGEKEYAAGVHQIKYSPNYNTAQGIYMIEVKTASRQSAKRLVRME